jgi:hypothetical protein
MSGADVAAFTGLYLSVHPRADLQEVATEWVRYPSSLRELQVTGRDPRASEYAEGIPQTFRPYAGRSYQELLPRRLHDVFLLVMKGLGKVRDVGRRPGRGERMTGTWLAVHHTLSEMGRYGVPRDASVIGVLERLVSDLPPVAYDASTRAAERGREIVSLIADMQRVGETSPLTTTLPLVEAIRRLSTSGGAGSVAAGGEGTGGGEEGTGGGEEGTGGGEDGREVLSLLDVGCGDGSITREVCRLLGARRCCGVDVYPAEHVVPGVEYAQVRESDAEYPFEDESFDVVLLMEVLHHIRSDSQVLSILRKVRRDGIVVVKEHDVTSEDMAVYLDIRHGLDEVFLDGKTPEDYQAAYLARYMPRRVTEGLFRHGFRQVRIRDAYASNPTNPMGIYHAVFKRL